MGRYSREARRKRLRQDRSSAADPATEWIFIDLPTTPLPGFHPPHDVDHFRVAPYVLEIQQTQPLRRIPPRPRCHQTRGLINDDNGPGQPRPTGPAGAVTANQRASAPVVYWGTNREGGYHYAGRAHVVWPHGAQTGECGLPVDDVWEQRPPFPTHLCPECCVIAMAKLFPLFEIQQPPARQHDRQRPETSIPLPALPSWPPGDGLMTPGNVGEEPR